MPLSAPPAPANEATAKVFPRNALELNRPASLHMDAAADANSAGSLLTPRQGTCAMTLESGLICCDRHEPRKRTRGLEWCLKPSPSPAFALGRSFARRAARAGAARA